MRKILLLLFTTTALVALTAFTGQAPSGVYSLNGQQTVGNANVYFASVHEYYEFLCNGVIPGGITKWNGYWTYANGERVHRDNTRTYFVQHAPNMQATANAMLTLQLEFINQDNGGSFFEPNPTAEMYRDYLEDSTEIMDIEFVLGGADSVIWMLGEKGDWTGGKFVKHAKGDGKYFVLHANGKCYILARVSCFNNMTIKETNWLQTGRARIRDEQGYFDDRGGDYEDGYDGGKRPDYTITDDGKTVNIYVQPAGGAGGNVTMGNITANGGASNNNVSSNGGNATSTARLVGTANPNYSPNSNSGGAQPAPIYPPNPYYQPVATPYYGGVQPAYYGNSGGVYVQPVRAGNSFNFGLTLGGSGGNYRDGGCYGGYNTRPSTCNTAQRPQQQQQQQQRPYNPPVTTGGPHMGPTIGASAVNPQAPPAGGGPHMGYTVR